jgi:hypothetical protein
VTWIEHEDVRNLQRYEDHEVVSKQQEAFIFLIMNLEVCHRTDESDRFTDCRHNKIVPAEVPSLLQFALDLQEIG